MSLPTHKSDVLYVPNTIKMTGTVTKLKGKRSKDRIYEIACMLRFRISGWVVSVENQSIRFLRKLCVKHINGVRYGIKLHRSRIFFYSVHTNPQDVMGYKFVFMHEDILYRGTFSQVTHLCTASSRFSRVRIQPTTTIQTVPDSFVRRKNIFHSWHVLKVDHDADKDD
jgi:hypothetical protein